MSKPSPAYFATARPRVLAHRGLAVASGVAENTAEAFAAALRAGATHIESDLRATADGVAILHHDATFRRARDGRRGRVSALTLAQLRDPAEGPVHRILTLEEALTEFPEVPFNLDLKSADVVEPAVRMIRNMDARTRILLTSFGESRRRAAVDALSPIASSLSLPRVLRLLAAHALGLTGAFDRAIASAQAVQMPYRVGPLHLVTPRLLTKLHARGIEAHVWPVNSVAEMRTVMALGVDGVVTDRTDLTGPLAREPRSEY
ncbi:glycerophosphodiester phosphodiesterase family protein [Mycetocola tolaasinivorans]|uniref:glycerophosphodiester phosphodiesterase family protein n=1 Tax=Mycetocola tolaasinivorans TaxID=76635 RepID=UPI0016048083|nr:glycerophosphodiester phosphodiesterase family protein [Mycetocola tolaasinivorans]